MAGREVILGVNLEFGDSIGPPEDRQPRREAFAPEAFGA
jgi:hypothetical protein